LFLIQIAAYCRLATKAVPATTANKWCYFVALPILAAFLKASHERQPCRPWVIPVLRGSKPWHAGRSPWSPAWRPAIRVTAWSAENRSFTAE